VAALPATGAARYNGRVSTAPPIISVRDLAVQFERDPAPAAPEGHEPTDEFVLRDISFDVQRGETLVIMGASGCGKSTLLNCLIGELAPDRGSVVYRLPELPEVDIVRAAEPQRDAIRKKFGILFQSGALFSSLTVAENVALPLREHSHVHPDIIDIVVAMKLQQVRMLPHRDKRPSQLSGGQRKRAALARATALDPLILFYDEPSAGLDPVTTSTIDELIRDLSRKLQVTSVVVTHEMESAFRIGDRMIMLHAGRILRVGARAEFERLRAAEPGQLANDDERLIHQFLSGAARGPLAESDGTNEYEQILSTGEWVV
jgi:phospholipid/cholesterol/gamma-HCH transport system ATP-binding protein